MYAAATEAASIISIASIKNYFLSTSPLFSLDYSGKLVYCAVFDSAHILFDRN
jgi:hypothetical protein